MSFLNGLAETFKNSALSALGAGFQALQDPQAFLRDDLPADANPVAKWIQSRNRRACRLHARKEAAGEYSSLGALRRPRYERVCGPYLDSIGEGPTGGSYAPPFAGGQCSVRYSLVATGTYTQSNQCNNPANPSQTQNWSVNWSCNSLAFIYGPIGAPYLEPRNDGSGYSLIKLPCKNQSGNPSFVVLEPNHCAAKGGWSVTSLTLNRCDGNSDNCGSLPNEYKPPTYPPNLPSIGPPDISTPPPGGDGGDDVQVDDDGNIRICENGDCSDPFPPGGGGDPSEDPGEPDGDPKENDPSDPNDDTIEGCAEEGHILTGIKINFTQIPLSVSGPLDYYYRVCYVGFGPDLDLIDLVIDGKLVKDGQFVIPDSEFCKCFRVVVSPGWGLSVQAYSRPEKAE